MIEEKESIKDFLDGIKEGQKEFGENISIIINSIILSLIYLIGVGGTSIVRRDIFKKEFLDIKIKKEAKSYWKELNLGKKKMEDYYRQF